MMNGIVVNAVKIWEKETHDNYVENIIAKNKYYINNFNLKKVFLNYYQMNESSRRCRRFDCCIRNHHHENDHLVIFFNYPDDYIFLYSCNIPHSKLISNYKRIKYGKYDEFLILEITNNLLKIIDDDEYYDEDESLSFLIYLFELLKTCNLFFFVKKNVQFYKIFMKKYTEFNSNDLFMNFFPKFDIINDYYDFLVHCYHIEDVNFWNDYKKKINDADNIFSEIVSFL